MKKVYFILAIIFLVFLMIGCEKIDTDPKDPVVTKTYTVTSSIIGEGITVSPSGTIVVNEGSSKNFKFNLKNGFSLDSLVVNGVSVIPTTDTTYLLSNIYSDYDIKLISKKNQSYNIIDWNSSRLKDWQRDSIIDCDDNGPCVHGLVWGVKGLLQLEFTFLPDGNFKQWWNGEDVGGGQWSLDERRKPTILNIGGLSYRVVKLDEKNLVIISYSVGWNRTETFTRHNK